MLHKIKSLEEYIVWAKDGKAGKVHEFYLDKNTWAIRYMVVDIGHWLQNKFVLVQSEFFGRPQPSLQYFQVQLTKEQIENSPDVHVLKPVIRPDYDFANYLTWPNYVDVSDAFLFAEKPEMPDKEVEKDATFPLISSKGLSSLRIHASDGFIGHIEDVVVDDSTWKVTEIIVNTKSLFTGGKLLMLKPTHVSSLSFEELSLKVDLDIEGIKNCPQFSNKSLE